MMQEACLKSERDGSEVLVCVFSVCMCGMFHPFHTNVNGVKPHTNMGIHRY